MSNWDTSTGQVSRVLPHECDHTNCIPRSELPGLPAWAIGKPIEELLGDSAYWKFQQDGMTRHEFLAALLNTCYPAPTATGNGAGK